MSRTITSTYNHTQEEMENMYKVGDFWLAHNKHGCFVLKILGSKWGQITMDHVVKFQRLDDINESAPVLVRHKRLMGFDVELDRVITKENDIEYFL